MLTLPVFKTSPGLKSTPPAIEWIRGADDKAKVATGIGGWRSSQRGDARLGRDLRPDGARGDGLGQAEFVDGDGP